MRQLAVVATALLALAACKKEQPAPTPAEQPAAPAAKEAAAAPAPAEEKVVVDEALVEKYAAFQKDMLAAIREGIAKSTEAAGAAGKDAVSQTVAATKVVDAMEQMDQREKELLAKHGLTHAQMEEAREVVADVITARTLLKTAGGTQELIKQMREAVKTMPEKDRAEGEAQVTKMEKDFADMTNAADARKKYGDAAVEAVLKHEEELSTLQTEALKALGGK
jgi:vacuolar-type H+-ATPase subunit I/STV1